MHRWIISILAFAIVLYGAPVTAQVICGPRNLVLAKLIGMHGETRRGIGTVGSGSIVEIWAACRWPHTWSITRTNVFGMMCIMAIGQNWQDDNPEVCMEST